MQSFRKNSWANSEKIYGQTEGQMEGQTDGPFQPRLGIQKEGSFCTIYFVWRNFLTFKFYLNVQYIEYPFKIYKDTFTYQKTLLHTLFCLLLKSLKAFSVNYIYNFVSKKQKVEVTEWSKEIYDNTTWQSHDKKNIERTIKFAIKKPQ